MTDESSTRVRRRRRVRTHTVLQMHNVDCGAASLAMILGHWRKFVGLDELRVACGVSRDGSSAKNIVLTARRYGLLATGVRMGTEQIRELEAPAIIHWCFNHFVVVEGYARGRYLINDPAFGPRKVGEDEFDRSFTGVVLTFAPGPEFTPSGRPSSLFRSLRGMLAGTRAALAFLVLIGLLLVIPGLVIPTFSQLFVDNYLVAGDGSWVGPLLLAMLATAGARGLLTSVRQRYLTRVETRLALASSSRFMWHVLCLPVGFYAQRYGGEIGSRVALNDRVATLVSGEFATAMLDAIVVVFFALVMLQYGVGLTAVVVGLSLLNLVALEVVARRRRDTNHRLTHEQGKLIATTMSGLEQIETIKASGSEDDFFARWSGHKAKLINGGQELGVTTLLLLAIPALLAMLSTAAILGIGGLAVMDGRMTVGMLVAFQSLAASFATPVASLVRLGSKLQEARADVARLDDVMSHARDPELRQDFHERSGIWGGARLTGRVELQQVTFGYSELGPPLIVGLDLYLEPGARVALVGPSGSGKSTVAKLIAGLYQPSSGAVLFDRMRRDSIPRSVLANSIAMVEQDVHLFSGTIRENIILWDASVSETSIIAAARDAALQDEITQRPATYEAVVEDNGRNFSGGQRQRLELARALAIEPTILILDEATSALDPTTEKQIDDAMRRRGCTCIIVAHRLSAIRDCDEIIVLDRGAVVQRGTHEQLITDSDGLYAALVGLG
jgi:NHLM bacteriocin system ABC transporter peptidase/ATP-binding protein